MINNPPRRLTPDDDAALRMLAGANFDSGASLTLPSGLRLDAAEAQALTAAYANPVTTPRPTLREPKLPLWLRIWFAACAIVGAGSLGLVAWAIIAIVDRISR